MALREKLGRLVLLEETDVGSLGREYRAARLGSAGLDRLVSVLCFAPAVSSQATATKRLMDEARLAAKLQNPGLVRVLGIGRVEQTFYVSTELIEGRTLASVFQRCRQESFPFAADHALMVASRVASALEYLHGKKDESGGKLFHGLLAPSRIVVSYDGEVKIKGLGLWSSLRETDLLDSGERLYLAPEQVQSVGDPRADVYALGLVLLQSLTGRAPDGSDPRVGLADTKIVSVSGESSPVPKLLIELLDRSLAADPAGRYPSMAEMRKAIDTLLFSGDFTPTTFDLAFFMHTLFREDMDRESRAIDEARRADYKEFLDDKTGGSGTGPLTDAGLSRPATPASGTVRPAPASAPATVPVAPGAASDAARLAAALVPPPPLAPPIASPVSAPVAAPVVPAAIVEPPPVAAPSSGATRPVSAPLLEKEHATHTPARGSGSLAHAHEASKPLPPTPAPALFGSDTGAHSRVDSSDHPEHSKPSRDPSLRLSLAAPEPEASSRRGLWIGLAAALVLAGVGGGIFYLRGRAAAQAQAQAQQLTPEAEAALRRVKELETRLADLEKQRLEKEAQAAAEAEEKVRAAARAKGAQADAAAIAKAQEEARRRARAEEEIRQQEERKRLQAAKKADEARLASELKNAGVAASPSPVATAMAIAAATSPSPTLAAAVPAAPTATPATQATPDMTPSPTTAPVQPGALVAASDPRLIPPFQLSGNPPVYPPLAQKHGIEGSVELMALIDETGKVADVTIKSAKPKNMGFEQAATTAVRSRRYRPGTKEGVQVRVWQAITINFKRR